MQYIKGTKILRNEFQCPHCGAFPLDFDESDILLPYSMLFEGFDIVRDELNRAIKVSSGYRCPDYNRQIGGAYLSAHLFGLGLDVLADSEYMWEEMNRIIEAEIPDFRVGKSRDRLFFHLDVAYLIHPRASKDWHRGVRWTYE